MRDHKHFDLADRIVRRHQFRFDVPGQIAAGEKRKLAELQQQTHARGVVGGIVVLWLVLRGNGIRLTTFTESGVCFPCMTQSFNGRVSPTFKVFDLFCEADR